MIDSTGAQVILASSGDENHPPENITDGNSKTFWMSTGMFPQEFIIRFAETTNISAVAVDSYNDALWKVEKVRESCSFRQLREDHAKKETLFQSSILRHPHPLVKHLKIEKNTSQSAAQFEPVTQKEFELTEGQLQSNTISLNGSSATHLRFIITAGYDHFVSVHRVSVKT